MFFRKWAFEPKCLLKNSRCGGKHGTGGSSWTAITRMTVEDEMLTPEMHRKAFKVTLMDSKIHFTEVMCLRSERKPILMRRKASFMQLWFRRISWNYMNCCKQPTSGGSSRIGSYSSKRRLLSFKCLLKRSKELFQKPLWTFSD